MLELSLHILDLCHNAAKAGAARLWLEIIRRNGSLLIRIRDDGHGMSDGLLQKCFDPFTTTRKTRRIGLGLPLMKACAQRCDGWIRVRSKEGQGTETVISLRYDHIDCPPMGDLTGAVQTIAAMERPILFFRYEGAHGSVTLDMQEIGGILGEIPTSLPAVFGWIGEYLKEGLCRADGAEALNAGEIYFGGAYTMKSVAELEAIRLATLEQVNLRREHEGATHVVIAMGTCGIAAGAKDVLKAFMAEANARGLMEMTIAQTGCMGNCALEPVVEVACPGMEKVIYTKVKPEMVSRIVAEHIVGGQPVEF